MTRHARSLARWIVPVLLLLPGSGAAQGPPAPGALVDVGGHRLHLHCVGSGTPVVVIDGGAGSWSIFYRAVQERIARETRTCAYDRAGLGWSGPGPVPRTSTRMADELAALLDASGEAGPFVLVGHSLGGWNVRILAARRPDLVAGVVLAEAAHEEQWDRLPPEARALLESAVPAYRAVAEAVRAGGPPEGSVSPWPFPEDDAGRAAYEAAMARPATWETMAGEAGAAVESAAEVAAAGDLGDAPLAVVTARRSFAAFEGTGIPIEAANAAWMEMQEELGGLSSDARLLVSEAGDHRIHRTDPDLLVRAVLDVVERVEQKEVSFPAPEDLRVLPDRSDPAVDRLLAELEAAYASMDADRFVDLFAPDFEQVDVERRMASR